MRFGDFFSRDFDFAVGDGLHHRRRSFIVRLSCVTQERTRSGGRLNQSVLGSCASACTPPGS
jgi:hypothetical protein